MLNDKKNILYHVNGNILDYRRENLWELSHDTFLARRELDNRRNIGFYLGARRLPSGNFAATIGKRNEGKITIGTFKHELDAAIVADYEYVKKFGKIFLDQRLASNIEQLKYKAKESIQKKINISNINV